MLYHIHHIIAQSVSISVSCSINCSLSSTRIVKVSYNKTAYLFENEK